MADPRSSRRQLRPTEVVELSGGPVEYAWVDGADGRAPVVLLHEGLGCVTLWRDFPFLLAEAAGRRVLVYSRHGYGGSGPAVLPRPPDFMRDEARRVLPELVERLGVPSVILVGHSDGASIALIAAGEHTVPASAVGVLAPHVLVEDRCVAAIAHIRREYLADDRLRGRLARHHRDPDGAFWGWNDVWLSEAFQSWNIEDLLSGIDVPVVGVQGAEDPYGTLLHVRAIERSVSASFTGQVLAGVGHAPQAERPAETVAALVAMLGEVS